MSAVSYEDLIAHKGHKIVCVTYESKSFPPHLPPYNVALECEDCNEVLLSFDKGVKE